MKQFDCVVIGGGMIGAASALSLAELGLSVAVVERNEAQPFSSEQAFDLRVSAISLGSEHLLTQLGAWQQIKQWRLCPYQRLSVWEQEQSYTEFNAKEIAQSHLGHIIENRLIQLALWQPLRKHKNIEIFCPDSVTAISQKAAQVNVTLNNMVVQTKLLIGADGANSQIRKLAGIGITGWDYQQAAMLINVETELPQQDITWQQYLPSGPVAMLPMPGNRASLVWYQDKAEIKRLAALSNEQLEQKVLQHFPRRLAGIKVLEKAWFPLTRRHANQYYQGQTVLLGDAAHTINPMAGQGVNLGFKDVMALQQVIAEAIAAGEPWYGEKALKAYQHLRKSDNLLMMSTMDALYATFNHPSSAMKLARNVGLSLVNKMPYLKRKALAHACGI